MTSFQEKPRTSDGSLVSGGFFVFRRRIFDYLTPDENCDLEYGALEHLADKGELMVYRHDGFWFCVDILRDMEEINKMWKEGNARWKLW